jgi:DNA-binding NarL/FixJ family response regulator
MPIKVLIADHHDVLRLAIIRMRKEADTALEVMGEAFFFLEQFPARAQSPVVRGAGN